MDEKMKVGIGADCECGDTFEQTIKKIKEAGFTHVMPSDDGTSLGNDLEFVRQNDLEVPYVHLGYGFPLGTSENDLWKQEASDGYVEYIKAQLEILKQHDIKTAVIHSSYMKFWDGKESPSKPHGVATMKEIVKIAEGQGIKIAVENTSESSTGENRAGESLTLGNLEGSNSNLELMCHLLDKVPELGFCYDSGHQHKDTPQIDLLKEYGDRLVAVHLHDNSMDDKHLIPGDGGSSGIDFQQEINALTRTGYDGVIMLEVNHLNPKTKQPKQPYEELTSEEFLQRAHKHGTKLAEVFNTAKQQSRKSEKVDDPLPFNWMEK